MDEKMLFRANSVCVQKMAQELARVGLYLDDLNKVKIVEPTILKHALELKDNCKLFDDNRKQLQKSIGVFITILSDLGDLVEKEKMKAIGLRNKIKSVTQDREKQQQKLQALIMEKTMESERLQAEYHSLQLVEVEQQELIEYLNEMR